MCSTMGSGTTTSGELGKHASQSFSADVAMPDCVKPLHLLHLQDACCRQICEHKVVTLQDYVHAAT